jgi:hypothetical protein
MFFSQKRMFSLGKKKVRCGQYFQRVFFFRRAAMTRTLIKKTLRCGQALKKI